MLAINVIVMLQPWWDRKGVWDRVEIVAAWFAAASGAITASLTQDYKRVPAALTFGFAAFTAVAKWQSKKLDDSDKARKAEEEKRSEIAYQAELNRLRKAHEAQARAMVRPILDDFKDRYFRKEPGDVIHKHRVTLFACNDSNGSDGKGKRLLIFARAGTYQESSSSWPVDDDDLRKCRGIAGEIWFTGIGRVATAACDWPEDGNMIEKATYADSLKITVDEAEALNVKSRVFTGAQIVVKGRRWGVILLDSCKEYSKHDNTYEKGLLNRYAKLIGAVLEGML